MCRLLTIHEAPAYVREIAIDTGYRTQTHCYWQCIKSLLSLHNETVNVWTHLLGLLYFVYALVFMLGEPWAAVAFIPLVIQLFTYQFCMLSSSMFHLLCCHSEAAHHNFRKLDHFGILFAMYGTYVALICEMFACLPGWKVAHLLGMSTVFILVCVGKYTESLKHILKAEVHTRPDIGLDTFVMLALYAFVPFGHWIALKDGIDNQRVQAKISECLVLYLIAAVGITFYATRFPEKYFASGTVDLLGASHQVWHVFVFCGMAFNLHVTHRSFAGLHEETCWRDGSSSVGIINNDYKDLDLKAILPTLLVKTSSALLPSLWIVEEQIEK